MSSITLRIPWGRVVKNAGSPHRSISVSQSCAAGRANEMFRGSRFLKKMMVGSNRSRKKFYTVDQPVSKTFKELGISVGGGSRSGSMGAPVRSKKCLRRVEVLNTIFMEQITSIMSTGEAAPEILGLGITVSRVKMSPDFSLVNVYWFATGTEQDDTIEPVLARAAGILRHELSKLRVIGVVPPIQFLKDKTYFKINEVEYLLRKCDFGDDFVPTSSRDIFRQLPTFSKKADSISEEDTDVEEDAPSPEIKTEVDLYNSTAMRQDILGVRHDVIMAEIKEMMNRLKNKQANANSSTEEDAEGEGTYFQSPAEPQSVQNARDEVAVLKQRQHDFFKYLKKQQLSRSIELKRLSTAAKEKEFYDDEAFERWKRETFGADFEDYDRYEEDNYEYEETPRSHSEFQK